MLFRISYPRLLVIGSKQIRFSVIGALFPADRGIHSNGLSVLNGAEGDHKHRFVGRIARDRRTEIFALRSAPPDSLRLLFNAIVQAHNDSAYTTAFHAVDMIRGLTSMTTNMQRRSVQQSHIWRMKRPCVIGISGSEAFFPKPRLHRISCCFISPAENCMLTCALENRHFHLKRAMINES